MKKYTTPSFEVVELETNDIMSVSGQNNAVAYAPLENVDTDGELSAIFDAKYWTSLFGNK